MTAELPDWMIPPRPSGWEADDLDHLPQAPRHTELIDGALIFMLSPRRSRHSRLVENLTFALRQAAPAGFDTEREMTSTYVATGIHRDRLKATVPFSLDIDLKSLVP